MYELKVKNGTYKADNLFWLVWVVFCHRMKHFMNGEKFHD